MSPVLRRGVDRVGVLGASPTAVVAPQCQISVAALSIHRREALQAIDFLMDKLKTDAPFWKKEVRADGSPEWIEPRSDDREARARWDADAKTEVKDGVKR